MVNIGGKDQEGLRQEDTFTSILGIRNQSTSQVGELLEVPVLQTLFVDLHCYIVYVKHSYKRGRNIIDGN